MASIQLAPARDLTTSEAISLYYARGWTCLPLSESHTPVVEGYSGRDERDLSEDHLREYFGPRGRGRRLGLRVPDNVIGIDVDQYGDKTGFDNLTWYEEGPPWGTAAEGLGPLPRTYLLTSRFDGMSGIRFFRVPPGLKWRDLGGSVETIQRHHRFAVAAPSVSKKTGYPYVWRHTSDWRECGIPFVDELPELPDAWVRHLSGRKRYSASSVGHRARSAGTERIDPEAELAAFRGGKPDDCIRRWHEEGLQAASGTLGAGYPNLVRPLFMLLRAGYGGCEGVRTALLEVLDVYDARDPGVHAGKFWSLIESSLEKAEDAGWTCTSEIGEVPSSFLLGTAPLCAASATARTGWIVSHEGNIHDFRAYKKASAPLYLSGDGGSLLSGTAEEQWTAWQSEGSVFETYVDAETAAQRVRAERAREARDAERKRAGYIDWADDAFWNPPEPKILIPGIAGEGQTVSLIAPGGLGKSLIAQDSGIGLTVRENVFGVDVQPATIIYLDRENSGRGVSKRMTAMGISTADHKKLRDRFHYSLLGSIPDLDTEAGGRWLMGEVEKTGATCIIVDTASKVVAGEENSNDTWKGLHNHTLVGLRARGVAVIILDHVGKDEGRGARGGSAKKDNCDVMWSLSLGRPLHTGEEVLVLTCMKDRDGDFGGEGSKRHLIREKQPITRHRFPTLTELEEIENPRVAASNEYEDLVRRIAQDSPDEEFTVRKLKEAVREVRGTCTDNLVTDAVRTLKDAGELTAKGRWIPVADRHATETPHATDETREE